MKFKRVRKFIVEIGEPMVLLIVCTLFLLILLLFKLGTLVPLFSRPEVLFHATSTDLKAILDVPFNAPYKLMVYGLDQVGYVNGFSLRAISALFGLLAVALFYYIVSSWHDRRTAIFGTALFACSAWFLHYARLAIPDITLTLILAALAYGHWIRKTKHSALVGIIGIGIAAWLLYIPGMIWFVVLGGIWQSRQIASHLKQTKLSIPLVIMLGVIIVAPLAYSISQQPELLKRLGGLPLGFWPTPYDIVRHILNVPFQIFFRGPDNPVIWLGRLPLLDIFAASMCLLGLYSYYQKRKLDRSKLLFGILVIGSVLVGLKGSVSMIILAPFVFIFVTAGIAYLLAQWTSVFPRNPLAKSIGVILISLAVVLSCAYNLRHYFVAWPGAPATKKAFQLQI